MSFLLPIFSELCSIQILHVVPHLYIIWHLLPSIKRALEITQSYINNMSINFFSMERVFCLKTHIYYPTSGQRDSTGLVNKRQKRSLLQDGRASFLLNLLLNIDLIRYLKYEKKDTVITAINWDENYITYIICTQVLEHTRFSGFGLGLFAFNEEQS